MRNQIYRQIFFTNVIRLLEEREWTTEHLSKISGVSTSFISDLKNGRGNPSIRIMEQLADAFETTIPLMLETTDLDDGTLNEISNGVWSGGLPYGYEKVVAVLSKFHAYIVKQWAIEDKNSEEM